MTQVTSALMYEVFRQIQADVITFMDAQRETKGALSDIRIQMARLQRKMNAYATLVNDTQPGHAEKPR
jgi:hypothetical protein